MPDFCRSHVNRSRELLRRNAGYTLAEIAVAVTIAGIVLAGGYATYAFVSSRVAAWQGQTAIENAAHRTLRELSADIRSSVRLQSGRNEVRITLSVAPNSGEPLITRYARSQAPSFRLLRNGVPLHDPAVSTLHVDVRPRPAEGGEDKRSSDNRFSGKTAENRLGWDRSEGGDRRRSEDAMPDAMPANMRCARAGSAQETDAPDAFGVSSTRGSQTRGSEARGAREAEGDTQAGSSDAESSDAARPLYDVQLHLATRHDTLRVCTSVRPRSPQSWPDVTLDGEAEP